MIKQDANLILRIGFGLFFLLWGIEKIRRVELWASNQMLGSFYGSSGTNVWLVFAVGIVQVLVALSFLANIRPRNGAIISMVMIASSIVVTAVPMVTYIAQGGVPIPSFLFVDHFPLLAGALAIYVTSEKMNQPTTKSA